ncbi:pilus assembly protein [Acinetobacter schindleri]|uniref:pilus assembly protein n=1 Tax=Acinetobacter schindleri TaxID=108981 RepID=UPI003F54B0D7
MKAKKYKQGLVTSLTVLSTAMLCQTATTYASDIEIYKAPTTGGASLMMVLDRSNSMRQDFYMPINTDFGLTRDDCGVETTEDNNKYYKKHDGGAWFTDTVSYVYTDAAGVPNTYNFTGNFCYVDKSRVTNSFGTAAQRAALERSCKLINGSTEKWVWEIVAGEWYQHYYNKYNWEWRWRDGVNARKKITVPARDVYKCPDRLTMLQTSLYDLIGDKTKLPDTAAIGFTKFPDMSLVQATTVLNDAGRKALLAKVSDFSTPGGGTPIAAAYSVGAKNLHTYMSTAERACAGFGVYMLTDGEPASEELGTARSDSNLNSYLTSGNKLNSTNCSSSWPCVETGAGFLANKKNTYGNEVKTAIVGFGSEFGFRDTSGNIIQFNSSYTAEQAANLFNGTYQKAAARAAVAGKGGWFSADNTSDIVSSVTNFVNSIKVPIPAITTGTSAIPQDVLNTSVIQPYAYFPQFEPKPSEEFRAWAGNLKKYNVSNGLLTDKNNLVLFTDAGVLNKTNEDLWTPNYATGTTLTADQQRLKELGGLLSRLNLKKTGSTLNRKVFTSNGATLETVDEAYIKQAPKTRGYYLGLLGYDITNAQVQDLASNFDLSRLPQTTNELRQIGAVMHSTPVLLTQSGKIVNSTTGNDTTNRDDYVLFGTTQGVLHVVKAGKSDEITKVGNTAGQEVFAFVPQEMLAAQGKAFLDPPQTVVEGGTSNGMNNLYYGVDGAWTAHTEYVYNTIDETFKVYETSSKYGKQWVYGGLRMGGRSYYALDLTKMAETTGNEPVVKFRINPAQSRVDGFTTPSGETERYRNLAKMGQSWSKPVIANVQWKGKRRLVMFVGGGYDEGYEDFKYNQTNGTGAGVYMFDADTGEFLWSTYDAKDTAQGSTKTLIGDGDHLKYSVVSQIKVVDREGDGDVDHLYFGDLGGQVFRVDLDKDHSSTGTSANYAKQITRIYNGNIANGYSPRFYEMPSFTVYNGTGGLFAVISIGSGNRSTPLLGKMVNNAYIVPNETTTTNSKLVNDAIYNIYDKVVTQTKPHEATLTTSPTISNLHALTSSQRELAATSSNSPTPSNLATWKEGSTLKGWYYPFTSSANIGTRKAVEKVQGDLIAIDNDLYVSTFDAEGVGTTEACGAGIYGNSRAHRFCMPYGQCVNGDTVASNTLVLGKGLLGITMGPGTTGADRRIIAPLGSLPNGNKITGITYSAANKLIPQSWYEKN